MLEHVRGQILHGWASLVAPRHDTNRTLTSRERRYPRKNDRNEIGEYGIASPRVGSHEKLHCSRVSCELAKWLKAKPFRGRFPSRPPRMCGMRHVWQSGPVTIRSNPLDDEGYMNESSLINQMIDMGSASGQTRFGASEACMSETSSTMYQRRLFKIIHVAFNVANVASIPTPL